MKGNMGPRALDWKNCLVNPEIKRSAPSGFVTNEARSGAAASSLAANGTEKNGTEIPAGTDYQCDMLQKWLRPLSKLEDRKSSGNAGGGLGRCRSSVGNYRSGTLVKCHIWQINAGQHSNKQHEKRHATQNNQTVRIDSPMEHVSSLFCQSLEPVSIPLSGNIVDSESNGHLLQ